MAENKENKIQWVRSPDGVFDVYANLAHITWSLDDVRVRLAQLVPSSEALSPGKSFRSVAEEKGAITFSWRNAKVLAIELSKVVQNYETVNGEINLHPALAASPDAAPPEEKGNVH